MQEQFVDIRPDEGGLRLHIRTWAGRDPAFLLVHGLSSNNRTWRQVADLLAAAGHRVVTVDQRGHGRSDKPDSGYDFATVTDDLVRLIQKLELERPVVAGQSWGGNVVLDLGAHHPDLMRGLVLVDGGYIEMQLRPEATWEQISVQLRPPDLVGTPYAQMLQRMQNFHPEWSEEGILDTLENFERMADDTVRPWLLLSRHMQILRALWEHRPSQLYPLVTAPVLICVAEDARSPERMQMKRAQVELAQSALAHATVHWFPATDHDIHVHRPQALAQLMLSHFEHVER